MLNKIVSFLHKHQEILLYLLFGFLTTVVNFLVYLPLHNGTSMLASVANVFAWIAAVVFAFLTNKPFVFKSSDWSVRTVFHEAVKFVCSRIGSLIVETLILFVTVDLIYWNGNYMKIITSILVVVMNYVTSKLIVFNK